MKLSVLTTQLINGNDLSYDDMRFAMHYIMSGQVNDIQIAGFLTALATKGETPTELQAGAEIMCELATVIEVNNTDQLVDPVGTGGTNAKIFNVSTASSVVSACAGVKIAKHGGRAASSKSGSADLLEKAGVNLDLTPVQIAQSIEIFGMGFLFAPNMHSAMRHVSPIRKLLGVRTVFNLLGPLTNPSGAKRQVLGVFDKCWLLPMAEVSKKLGKQRVMVVHSRDGLDEISIAAPTDIVELKDDKIRKYSLNPADYGMLHNNLQDVRVHSVAESLELILAAFDGKRGPVYDMIALNSAAIIQVAGITTYESAVRRACHILDSGQAHHKLSAFADFTRKVKEH